MYIGYKMEANFGVRALPRPKCRLAISGFE